MHWLCRKGLRLIMLVSQNKQLDVVKNGSRASTGSTQTSRAVSVSSNGTPAKGKAKGKKK